MQTKTSDHTPQLALGSGINPVSTQLVAQIKKTSKYHGQGKTDALFPVSIQADETGGYVVCGGPGGQYRLADVHLFAVVGDSKVKLS